MGSHPKVWVAAGAFAAGVVVRPDAAMGLVVLGSVFVVLERRFPVRRQPVRRPGFATDCVHFLADELLAALVLAAGLALLLPVGHALVPEAARQVVGRQPPGLVVAEALLLAEVCGYWGHRLTHEVGVLWRFHRLHHSIETMDWLAPNRRHPVDMAFARASVIVPLVVAGFTVPGLAAHFAIKRFQGLLVHANLRLDAGLLTWLIATPEFHHWHHADHPEARNRNYAGQLPLVDWAFGTLHLPRPAWPARYGCGERAPDGYVDQLLWPFRGATPILTCQVGNRASTVPVRSAMADRARALFSFPDPVNEVSARLVATGVVVLAVTAIALDFRWVTIVLAYGFLARVLTGPSLSPLGQLVTRVITPRLAVAPRLVAGPPKRFAQGIGAAFAVTAVVLTFGFGNWAAAQVVLGVLVAAASLEAFAGICLGCKVFALLMRVGIIPAEVCERCNDIWSARGVPA